MHSRDFAVERRPARFTRSLTSKAPGWTRKRYRMPDAFLRRCFFHYISFPDHDTMKNIVDVHFPGLQQAIVRDALEVFFDVRKVPGLKKKPSTSELIDWLKLLMADELSAKMLQEKDTSSALPPLYGALVKNEQDVHLLQKLAFMARRRS